MAAKLWLHMALYILRVPGQTVSTSPKTQGVSNPVSFDQSITSAAYPQTPKEWTWAYMTCHLNLCNLVSVWIYRLWAASFSSFKVTPHVQTHAWAL